MRRSGRRARIACTSATTRSELERRVEQGEERLPVALGGFRVVDGRVTKDPAVLGRVGLDRVVDAALGERSLEACLHVVGEGRILDGAGDVDPRFDLGGEEVRAVRRVRREAASVVGGGGDDAIGVGARRGQGHQAAHAVGVVPMPPGVTSGWAARRARRARGHGRRAKDVARAGAIPGLEFDLGHETAFAFPAGNSQRNTGARKRNVGARARATEPVRASDAWDQVACMGTCGGLRCASSDARWSSLVARRAHNPKVVGSNPTRATK